MDNLIHIKDVAKKYNIAATTIRHLSNKRLFCEIKNKSYINVNELNKYIDDFEKNEYKTFTETYALLGISSVTLTRYFNKNKLKYTHTIFGKMVAFKDIEKFIELSNRNNTYSVKSDV